MNDEHPDPHADGLARVGQMAAVAVTAAEGVVRLRAGHLAARAAVAAAPPGAVGPTGANERNAPSTGTTTPERARAAPPSRPRTGSAAPTGDGGRSAPRAARAGGRGPVDGSPERARRETGRSPAALTSSRAAAPAHREDLLAVHRQAAAFFRDRLEQSWAPSYLQERGLQAATTQVWGAGYAPASWTALTDHLRVAGWDDATLEASGLSRRARTGNLIDHFRDRLILPVRESDGPGDGDVMAFIGRARPDAREGVPKYLNSPRTAVYDKGAVLYGLSEGRDHLQAGGTPVLVEGPLDAVAVTTATRGRYVGLAPCGTSLTDGHVQRLAATLDVASRGVVVATDGDPAGVAAAVRAYERLSPLTHRLLRAELPDGADPATLLQHHGAEALSVVVNEGARPLLDVVLDTRLEAWSTQLHWVEGRVGAARDVAGLLAALPVPLRARYAARLATRLDLAPSTVTQILNPDGAARRSAGEQPGGAPHPWPASHPTRAATSPPTAGTSLGTSSTPPAAGPAVHSRRPR